jgi:hypothetical protein
VTADEAALLAGYHGVQLGPSVPEEITLDGEIEGLLLECDDRARNDAFGRGHELVELVAVILGSRARQTGQEGEQGTQHHHDSPLSLRRV